MKRHLIALLIVAALMPWPLLVRGDHWWAFILATGAIVTALRLALGRQWAGHAGLKLPPIHAALSIAAFIAQQNLPLLPNSGL